MKTYILLGDKKSNSAFERMEQMFAELNYEVRQEMIEQGMRLLTINHDNDDDNDNFEDILKDYLSKLESGARRFNFFISKDLDEYLGWVPYAKNKPRAEFVRNLIRREMEKDGEYKKYLKKKKLRRE